ncbi:MAG: diguanylate cyclase [Armatimonadota bacterium]|nr:diguanylate cyclase [Armatimonadota bacterium]
MDNPEVDAEPLRPRESRSLGIRLPPGYRILETPGRVVLSYGEAEISSYPPDVPARTLEADAARHFAEHYKPLSEDSVTALPWSTAVRRQAAQLARKGDLHAICVRLTGLAVLVDLLGPQAAGTVVSKVATRLKRLVADPDLLARHSSTQFLLFTTRALTEAQRLAEEIRREVARIAVEARGELVPSAAVGLASTTRVERAAEADPTVEALVLYAESLAASGADQESALVSAPPTDHELSQSGDAGPGRVILVEARAHATGEAATAIVRLLYGDRVATGKVVGSARDVGHPALVAAATAQAVTMLLPDGCGISVRSAERLISEAGEAIWVEVSLQTPEGEERLVGIAPLTQDPPRCAARAVLRAIDRRISLWVGGSPGQSAGGRQG